MIANLQVARIAVLACVALVFGSGSASAQCPAGSTCFGEVDTNSQNPSLSFSGDILGARWLMHLGDFQLTFSSDSTASTQALDTGDTSFTTFLNDTYRPKVAFTHSGDILAAGKVRLGGGVDASGGGFKHVRVGGCSASSPTSPGAATCDITLTWPGDPFADTNYTAVCTPGVGGATPFSIISKSVSSITIQVGPMQQIQGGFFASVGEMDCIAIHD